MIFGVVRAVRRPGRLPVAGLFVVLAALVHLLGCAHGPAPEAGARVDSLAVSARWATDTAVPAADAAHRSPGPEADHCPGADVPPRLHPEPTLTFPDGAPAEPVVLASTVAPAGRPVPAVAGTRAPPPRERAVLGVWRI
ncbi:hypothetical protein [Streptomyces sp. NPDC014733]|uniref:hypothetical protein n=1 Tax=Streptomyces sp. NPDC014733 TaxID=3364885 RepID=UPI0036FEBAA8